MPIVCRFTLPIYMTIGYKKISLNMNVTRNTHYQILNKIKQLYWPISEEVFKAEKISIAYTLVWNNNRRTDRMNWISVADKFFLDWLVNRGYIADDDNGHYVETVTRHLIDKKASKSYIIADVAILEGME